MTELDRYRHETKALTVPELLAWAAETFAGDSIAFASSVSAEDQVITHLLSVSGVEVPVFTLDTGRLHQQTYDTLEATRERYGIDVAVFFPDRDQVERMVGEHGPNLFYRSIENRRLCCHIRKVVPLGRALQGKRAWICGLRKGQSTARSGVEHVAWDDTNGLYRIAPLAAWSEEDVWQFIRRNDIPYNPLHDRGFPSIGCAPCTRAVKPGEDLRSGRWWWEQEDHRECGLHGTERTVRKSRPTEGDSGAAGSSFGITTFSP